jgi:hypothetical protein
VELSKCPNLNKPCFSFENGGISLETGTALPNMIARVLHGLEEITLVSLPAEVLEGLFSTLTEHRTQIQKLRLSNIYLNDRAVAQAAQMLQTNASLKGLVVASERSVSLRPFAAARQRNTTLKKLAAYTFGFLGEDVNVSFWSYWRKTMLHWSSSLCPFTILYKRQTTRKPTKSSMNYSFY